MVQCANCGNMVDEHGKFCVHCGAQIPRKSKKMPIAAAIMACVALVAVVALVATLMAPHNTARVAVTIVAPGYSATTDSPIPLRIIGAKETGEAVDEVAYVDGTKDFGLEAGSYEISLDASPLCQTGVLYTGPTKPVSVTVTQEDCKTGAQVQCGEIELTTIPAGQATAEQIEKAYQGAIQAGFNREKADAYRKTAESNAGGSASNADAASEAYYRKLMELQETWGSPQEKAGDGGKYISGLAYARLFDFGDGQERLLVSYYDPAGDRDTRSPGGYPESYPVQVWEYDASADGGVKCVYDSTAQLSGQNTYCVTIMLAYRDNKPVLCEWRGVSAPNGEITREIWGLLPDGSFGVTSSCRQSGSSYEIDGKSVSQSEAAEYSDKWYAAQDAVSLTALTSTDRSVQPAIDQTKQTIADLKAIVDPDGDAGDSGDEADESVIQMDGYEFTIPEYWRGKVDMIEGTSGFSYPSVKIYPKGFDPDSCCLAEVYRYPAENGAVGGDYIGHQQYVKNSDETVVVCVHSVNWPVYAHEIAHGVSAGSLYTKDSTELETLVDLSSGGTLTYDQVVAAGDYQEFLMTEADFSHTICDSVRFS